ncbi:hypothetical protein GY12_04065 [Micrococcus luteus]|nr:hypothetical protein GY12_04065 [Micrococcus luteus]
MARGAAHLLLPAELLEAGQGVQGDGEVVLGQVLLRVRGDHVAAGGPSRAAGRGDPLDLDERVLLERVQMAAHGGRGQLQLATDLGRAHGSTRQDQLQHTLARALGRGRSGGRRRLIRIHHAIMTY